MFFGFTRVFVLLSLAAILANVPCAGACATASCRQHTSPCHQQPSSHNGSCCLNQNFEFSSGLQAGFANPGFPEAASMLPPAAVIAPEHHALLSRIDNGSPPRPGGIPSAISVLRI
jgi:hypothetical protein